MISRTYPLSTAAPVPFDYGNPSASMIDLRAIASHLASEPRWANNLNFHYSVAQHSLLVASIIPRFEWRIYGLLHDAAEMFTRDLPTSFKHWLVDQGADVYALERRILNCVWRHFELPAPTAEIAAAVDRADAIALATEWRDVVRNKTGNWTPPALPLPRPIRHVSPIVVEDDFLGQVDSYLHIARGRL